MMKRLRSGSNQMDVPVKPVCPNAFGPIFVPALELSDGVSQPRAREELGGIPCRCVNSRACSESIVLSRNNHVANLDKSGALLNNPAWPDTPPSSAAFSS